MAQSKPTNYASSELKNQISHLVQNREKIEKGQDVSGSMVKLSQTLTNIKPLLKKQQNYIKNFFSNQQSTSQQSKQSQSRRYINRICEIAMKDITQMLDVSQNYFSLEFKNNWNKIKISYEKEFNEIREQLSQKNMIEFMFKIINVKDYFIANFMRSILYRKILMWKDLSLTPENYVHSERKAILTLIEQEMLQKNYIPTKPVFDWMGFDIKGGWSMNKFDTPEFNLKYMLANANEAIENVFTILSNYANLTVEQRNHDGIDRNKEEVITLRKEVENARISYLAMQKKYREAILKDQRSDIVELKEKITNLEQALEQKDNELKKIKFQFRDSSNQINSLKQKIKELESDLNRVTNQQLKKLKELESVQFSLTEQFQKIHKNVSNFGSIFEFESDGKKSLAKQIMSKQKTIQKLVEMLGRQKTKTRNLGEQMTRLNTIILELGQKLRQ